MADQGATDRAAELSLCHRILIFDRIAASQLPAVEQNRGSIGAELGRWNTPAERVFTRRIPQRQIERVPRLQILIRIKAIQFAPHSSPAGAGDNVNLTREASPILWPRQSGRDP